MNFYNWAALEVARHADIAASRARHQRTREDNQSFALTDSAFIRRYRLSKALVLDLIDEVRRYIPERQRSDGLDVETKVLTALRFFASGSYQESVAESRHLSMCQASVSNCIHEVTEALNKPDIFTKYIKFPEGQDRDKIKHQFYKQFYIPSVVGCIDGTHVAIVSPSEGEENYFNRKGYHSLNVLIVCDADLQILSLDPSYPGSTHDSRVWKHNPLLQHLVRVREAGEEVFLLGDSGYPLRPEVMTPLLNQAPDTPEAYYTNLHVTTRCVVERCIGVLKARFRCLLAARTLYYDPVTAGKITNACAMLHNMAHGALVPYIPLTREEWEEELRLTRGASLRAAIPEPANAPRGSVLEQGQQVRRRLVDQLWRNRAEHARLRRERERQRLERHL